MQLFIQRARQVDWRFSLSEEEALVVRICQLVSGMPLGIELAAAQVGERSCREIAEAIERNLDSLRTTLRDVLPRHRSLRAAFDHSWALLSDEEQRVFRRLSVFRGGFRQEAAARVAAASRLVLAALERKSLLRCDAAGRFEVHEVLRQYAQQKLQEVPGEEEMIQERHCDYYAAFLEQRQPDLTGPRCEAALEEIGAEIENIRASWRWAVSRGKEAEIAKSLESLRYFYEVRGWFQEGEETFGRAVENLRGQIEQMEELQRPTGLLLGQILARRGAFCIELSQYARASEFLQTSLSLFQHCGARPEMSFPLLHLGSLAFSRGEYAEARRYHQQSLAISKEIGDQYGTARALLYLGTVAMWTGEYLEAKQLFQDSLAICRAMDEQLLMARVLNNLGNVAYFLKEYAEAKQFYQESLAFRGRLNDRLGIGACLNNLGEVAYALGEYQPAGHYFREALTIMANIKTVHAVLHIVTSIAALLAQDGEKARAIEMLVLVLHHPASQKTTRDRAGHLLSDLTSQLSAQQVAAAQERGKARRLEELVRQFVAPSSLRYHHGSSSPASTPTPARAAGGARGSSDTV